LIPLFDLSARSESVTVSDVTESDEACGAVERQVRRDIGEMGRLTGIRRSIAEVCYMLARQLDSGEPSSPASIARELVARLAELDRVSDGREVSPGDRIVAELADELAPRRRARPQAGAG
jgi:hypothetical protein